MLDIIMIILLLFAIILMIYSLEERRIALLFFDAILWLILGLFILQGVEIPYQLYNASSTKVITGVQLVQNNLTYLSYLFIGIGLLMFIATFTMALESMGDEKKKVK